VIKLFRSLVLILAVTTVLPGCAGNVTSTIVSARNRQGDTAINNGNSADAALAYKLALQLAPADEHARSGLAAVQLRIAAQLYQSSKFDDALAALSLAAKYDPNSVRLEALRTQIEAARIKREIVLSNYPAYRETGVAIRHAYGQLKLPAAEVANGIQRFEYTYDSAQLSKAIRSSIELHQEVGRLTNRLIAFRRLVESGSPQTPTEAQTSASSAASLLPLP